MFWTNTKGVHLIVEHRVPYLSVCLFHPHFTRARDVTAEECPEPAGICL